MGIEMTKTEVFTVGRVGTPVGEMLVVTDERERLRAADYWEYEARMNRLLRLHYGDRSVTLQAGPAPAELRMRLEDYFAGSLTAIDDIEVVTGGSGPH